MNYTLTPTIELFRLHEQNRYQPDVRNELAERYRMKRQIEECERTHRNKGWAKPDLVSLPLNFELELDLSRSIV